MRRLGKTKSGQPASLNFLRQPVTWRDLNISTNLASVDRLPPDLTARMISERFLEEKVSVIFASDAHLTGRAGMIQKPREPR